MFYFQYLIQSWLRQISPYMSLQILSFVFFWMLSSLLFLEDPALPLWIAVAASTLTMTISVFVWGKNRPEYAYALGFNAVAAGTGMWYIFFAQEE